MRGWTAVRLLGCVAASGLAGCGSAIGPSGPTIASGQYVLTDIDGKPAPFILIEAERADSSTITQLIRFDTLVVINDTSGRRHFKTATLRQLPGGPPEEVGSTDADIKVLLVPRENEIAVVSPDAFGFQPVYFAPRGRDLIQQVEAGHARCTPAGCTTLFSGIVEARYVRR